MKNKEVLHKKAESDLFSAPRIYRQNDDIEKLALAFFDGKELFVVRLKYFDVGVFALEKIEWFTVSEKYAHFDVTMRVFPRMHCNR